MALFILRTFNVQDEEIQGLHLPVVFSAVMNILNVRRHHLYVLLRRSSKTIYSFMSKRTLLEQPRQMSKRSWCYRRRFFAKYH